MDIDGLQKQIQEWEFVIGSINDLSEPKAAQIQHEWNSQTPTVGCLGINCEHSEEAQALRGQIQKLDQQIARLELDLKREKELRQIKYYRTDKKTTEIKKLYKEKDDLVNHWRKYETVFKDLERKTAQLEAENQQIKNKLQAKITECQEIAKNPHKSQIVYTERIHELETEIEELKNLIKTFETSMRKNPTQEGTKELLEKLSVMLLYKNVDQNFFSENQKSLIRSLFGDFATSTYKDKIKELTELVKSLQRGKVEKDKDMKQLAEKSLYYISSINKVYDKLAKESSTLDQYSYSQVLPSKDSLVEDKLNLLEKLGELDKPKSKFEHPDDHSEFSNFLNGNMMGGSAKISRELFSNLSDDSLNSDCFVKELGTKPSKKTSDKENLASWLY